MSLPVAERAALVPRPKRLVGILILALLMAVAVSARAEYPLGPSATSQGAAVSALGSVVQVLLLLSVAAFELILATALIFAPWRRLADAGKGDSARPVLSRWLTLRMAAVPVAVLLVEALLFALLLRHRRHPGSALAGAGSVPPSHLAQGFLPVVGPVSLVGATEAGAALAALLVAVAVAVRLRRRRSGGSVEELSQLPQRLADALDVSLAELASGGDPRQGVIAAYERIRHVLARVGLPELASETPREYLERAIGRLQSNHAALVALTDLFEVARFSTHVVGTAMRTQAETALQGLRTELGV
ncbi:MAG: DUF4129 domain-containing protein [Candidatus Dormiibacterota bacterium]